jgi:FkbM family methyltransferase
MTRYANDSRIIFDLGMNNGDDAAFYLERGYDVIALDANPALCDLAQRRFAAALRDGRLKILNAAISDRSGRMAFYVNLDNDHWSSLELGWAERNATRTKEISVRAVTLDDLFGEFGVPYYLKIDVEGVDQVVLDQLRGHATLPLYVSVEDCRFGFQYMETLSACGYDRFKLLDQSTVPGMTDPVTGHGFPAGSSGPFGDDVPGDWRSYGDIVKLYGSTVRDRAGNRVAPRTQWWDIHSTHIGSQRPT